MTVEEKRSAVSAYCSGANCGECKLNNDVDSWCHLHLISIADETALDEALKLIHGEEPKEDVVNHPNHYCQSGMECIDEMVLVFGKETVACFCLCNVWKYRKRALLKNGQEDMDKADWYMKKYKELVESD